MPRQRDAHVRRLFQSDGYTCIGWFPEDQIKEMLKHQEIVLCIDKRSGRELGYKLRENTREKASLLPFSRPTRPEDKFRYEIPHAGDCRSICLRRFNLRRFASGEHTGSLARRIIKVSARKLDFTRPEYRTTQYRGVTLPHTQVVSALNSELQQLA